MNMNKNKNKSNDNDKNKNNIDSEEKMTRQRLCLKRFFLRGNGVESAGIAAVAFMRFAHTQKN